MENTKIIKLLNTEIEFRLHVSKSEVGEECAKTNENAKSMKKSNSNPMLIANREERAKQERESGNSKQITPNQRCHCHTLKKSKVYYYYLNLKCNKG